MLYKIAKIVALTFFGIVFLFSAIECFTAYQWEKVISCVLVSFCMLILAGLVADE